MIRTKTKRRTICLDKIDRRFGNTPKSFKDLTGQRFGKLVVLYRGLNDKTGHVRWHCKCDCGTECLVYKDALLNGGQVSCGCYNKEKSKGIIKERQTNKYDLSGEYGIGYTHNNNKEFYFDLEDYNKIKGYCWREDINGYIVANKQYREMILLHRLIMNAENQNVDVDHIKHNLYDNRKSELRIVKHADNLKNQKINVRNTSGITGVSFNKRDKDWEAYITFNKNHIHLGHYKNFDDAVKARRDAEEKYFGEYSYTNSNKELN